MFIYLHLIFQPRHALRFHSVHVDARLANRRTSYRQSVLTLPSEFISWSNVGQEHGGGSVVRLVSLLFVRERWS